MRYRTFALAASLLAVTAAGCNRKPAEEAAAPPPVVVTPAPAPTEPAIPVPAGYHSQQGLDASGYYLSSTNVKVGNYQLAHLAIGAPSDFQTWETGDRTSTFGPVLIAFDDVTSPMAPNELGGEGHSVSVRVLPDAYSFDAGKLQFKGHDPKLGEVVFSGAFDPAALAQARNDGSSGATVLTGDLKVGNAPARKVALTYWVGD